MYKRQHKRKTLAQNFLKDPALVRRLVAESSIGRHDTVYEIGPGRGIITAELSRVATRVIAIEKDARLVRELYVRFRSHKNVEIIPGDFLQYKLRESEPYKIFASIPFNITAEIVRKILYTHPRPAEVFLIMQREPARKFAGLPRETLFSLLAKPEWEFRILCDLKRTAFRPMPDVDSVFLRMRSRKSQFSDQREYRRFVNHGFRAWKRDLRRAFANVFTYTQWKRLSRDLHFPSNALPTQLTFEQWVGLYRGYKRLVAK